MKTTFEKRDAHQYNGNVLIQQREVQNQIKGVGLVTAATFVGETGDIRRFEHPSQIQKLAGCNLVENSSGKHKGKTTISHRGRKRLRHGLFHDCHHSTVVKAAA